MSSFKRVIIVAPKRAVCMGIKIILENPELPSTLLWSECGDQITEAVAGLSQGGFGIVAGTGTGKTVALPRIACQVLGEKLVVGMVTAEHKADKSTDLCNVLVMTPGVALNWIAASKICLDDLIVFDEVHETSEHLELVMALLRAAGNTSVWMSATIDPERYRVFLDAHRVITCESVDSTRGATVTCSNQTVSSYLDAQLPEIVATQSGVVVFVPTRLEAQRFAEELDGKEGVYATFYHGGESAEKLTTIINGDIPLPFVVFMTPAGASHLNVKRLSRVVIVDAHYTERSSNGRRFRTKLPLDDNMLIQMAGRVIGRVAGGQVDILSPRQIDFDRLVPTAPTFVLGGDLEFLALSTASVGVDVRRLELIEPLTDSEAYERAFDRFVQRGLISLGSGRPKLTKLGKRVYGLPVSPSWAEVILRVCDLKEFDLAMVTALAASAGEIYKLTGRNWFAYGDKRVVQESDYLTCYNIVAAALQEFGRSNGRHYKWGAGLTDWCKEHNYSEKEIRNVAAVFTAVCERLKLRVPDPHELLQVAANDLTHAKFIEFLAFVQSMDYVHAGVWSGKDVYGNRNGLTTNRGSLGRVRSWTDRFGFLRHSIEGTRIPEEVMRRYAQRADVAVVDFFDDTQQAEVRARLVFAGQTITSMLLTLPVSEVPQEALRKFMNQQQLNRWTAQPPAVELPLTLNAATILPPLKSYAYGTDFVDGSELVIYGAVQLAHRLWRNPHGSEFQMLWTVDHERAQEVQRQTVEAVEALATGSPAATLAGLHEEGDALNTRLLTVYARQEWLSADLRDRLTALRKSADFVDVESGREWVAQAQKALADAQTQSLSAMVALRNEANRILVEYEDALTESVCARLDQFDIDDEELAAKTQSAADLWISNALLAIAGAQPQIAVCEERRAAIQRAMDTRKSKR